MLTGFTTQDHRSEDVMQNIMKRLELLPGWELSDSLIHLPYAINGKVQPSLTYGTAEEIAAFAEYNYLIDRFEVSEGVVTMYKRMPTYIKADRWGWCVQIMEEKVQARFPFRIAVPVILRYIARHYYDNGDMKEIRGRVIQMNCDETFDQNIA